MLQVKNLVVDLDGFKLTADFEIEKGSLISIVGPSGAGKSTLLNSLAGFIPLTSGLIKWNGSDITKLDPGLRPLSILFQDYNLFSHLTVKDNIAIGPVPGEIVPPAKSKPTTVTILSSFSCADIAHPFVLSVVTISI